MGLPTDVQHSHSESAGEGDVGEDVEENDEDVDAFGTVFCLDVIVLVTGVDCSVYDDVGGAKADA